MQVWLSVWSPVQCQLAACYSALNPCEYRLLCWHPETKQQERKTKQTHGLLLAEIRAVMSRLLTDLLIDWPTREIYKLDCQPPPPTPPVFLYLRNKLLHDQWSRMQLVPATEKWFKRYLAWGSFNRLATARLLTNPGWHLTTTSVCMPCLSASSTLLVGNWKRPPV